MQKIIYKVLTNQIQEHIKNTTQHDQLWCISGIQGSKIIHKSMNRMKDRIYMITSIIVGKTIWQHSTLFHDTQQISSRRNVPQYNKGHIWKANRLYQTLSEKLRFTSKIRDNGRMHVCQLLCEIGLLWEKAYLEQLGKKKKWKAYKLDRNSKVVCVCKYKFYLHGQKLLIKANKQIQ
jgi:hypothetical protein